MEQTVENIRKEKKARLEAWVEEQSNGIEQGGSDWLSAKKLTVGGSEIATILGVNPYMSVADLIAQKIGLKEMKSSIHMNWGNLFEPVLMKYMEHKKNTKIIGEKLFVVGRSPSQTYSPDGLAVVDFPGEPGEDPCPMITLFEFKCPFSRKIEVREPKVPAYYLPQVLTGLDTTIAEVGLYVEAVFRKCRWGDLSESGEYDSSFTPRDNKRRETPPAYGFVAFAGVASGRTREMDKRLSSFGLSAGDPSELSLGDFAAKMEEEGDLSRLGEADLAYLLEQFKGGYLLPWYSPILENDAEGSKEGLLSGFYDKITKYNDKGADKFLVYGVLPWKLLKMNEIKVEKKEGYVVAIQDKIDEVIDFVKLCEAEPSKKLYHYAKLCEGNRGDSD